ncbi:MAG: hypothetical protein OEY52_15715 [Gammaproteobacteria bacterium]|nr:hypothetical protein [Gammaproteobacteria bacterium]
MKSRLGFVSFLFIAIVAGGYFFAPTFFANAGAKLPVIGWLDSNCFAVTKKGLSNGTELFVVTLDGPQAVASATITGPANEKSCGPLADDRREHNASQGLSFYEIKSSTAFATAIGIVAKVANAKVKNEHVLADIDGDGKPEQFSMCATSEGLSFDVWPSEPFKQKPIWSGYYYLGYDVERTCP